MQYWSPVRNLLLSLLLAMFLGLLGQWFYELPGWFPGAMLLGAAWGSGMGLWQAKTAGKLPRPIFLLGLLLSAALCYGLFLRYVGAAFTGTLLVSVAQAVCFLFTARCQDSFYGPLGISTVLLSLPVLVLYWTPWLVPLAGLALVLTLDGFRVMGLYRSYHMGKAGDIRRRDPALSRSSLGLFAAGLLLLFCAAALTCLVGWGLSALGKQLWNAASGPLHQGYAWLGAQIDTFRAWFLSHFHAIENEKGPPDTDIKPHFQFGLPENSYLISWLPLAGLIAMLATIGFAATRVLRRPNTPKSCDYVDEIEALERPRFRLGDWLRQRKPQRLSDFSDNNKKVRFLFQQLLRRKQKSDPAALCRTPNELAESPAETLLAQLYNRVRYGGEQATDQEVAEAANSLADR